jgi:ABC-type amino acid transport substrate-binding protein
VVIKPVKPFVMPDLDAPSGFSIDLWRRVAQEAGLGFEFRPARTTREMLEALEGGSADVAVGALSITAEREAQFDFSHAYYESGLQILVNERSAGPGFGAFAGLLKADVLKVIGVLLLALLVNSHLLWLMERKRNPESFPDSYVAGVWESVWWSVCTLITGGCENKAPAGIAGRLVAIVWMLAGVGLFSYITATIASTMTVNTLTSEIRTLADLRGKRVVTVDGSTAQEFLLRQGIEPEVFPDVESAFRAVAEGRARAFVYDAPILRYQLNTFADPRLMLVGPIFEKQDYGFGLRPASPYREAINRALLALSEDGFVNDLDKKWFGTAR